MRISTIISIDYIFLSIPTHIFTVVCHNVYCGHNDSKNVIKYKHAEASDYYSWTLIAIRPPVLSARNIDLTLI